MMTKKVEQKESIPRYLTWENYITKKDIEQFLQKLVLSPQQRASIENLQQGTEEWLLARYGKLTGSIIGAVVGHNPFTSHTKLISEYIWGTFAGNEATRYGNLNEPKGANLYKCFMKRNICNESELQSRGLLLHDLIPFFAYSPDGLIVKDGKIIRLLEIKCPYKKQFYNQIALYYYDQIQYGMWLTKTTSCDFVVYCPEQTSIERFEYNEPYVKQFLLPTAIHFYFQKLLPLLIAKERKWLQDLETFLPFDVSVESFDYSSYFELI